MIVSDHAGFGNYFICPPIGTSMTESTAFEVAKRTSIVNIHNRRNVLLKNLALQGLRRPLRRWSSDTSLRQIQVENCSFSYCCSFGVNVTHSSELSFLKNRFYKNGIKGPRRCLCSRAAGKRRKRRSEQLAWRARATNRMDSAGIKFFQIHDSRFEKLSLTGNLGKGMGLWLDSDVETSSSRMFRATATISVFSTKLRKVLVASSTVSLPKFSGVYSSAADNLTLENVSVANNHGEVKSSFLVTPTEGGRTFKDFERSNSYRVLEIVFASLEMSSYWDKDNSWKP